MRPRVTPKEQPNRVKSERVNDCEGMDHPTEVKARDSVVMLAARKTHWS